MEIGKSRSSETVPVCGGSPVVAAVVLCCLLCAMSAGAALGQQPGAGAAPYQGLGAKSVSPELIQKYAPRPLDPELSRHIQTLLDIRAPGSGLLAPDGKALYFGWNVTGIGQVWRADGPERFPVQLTGGEDATRLVGITPNGRWLILQRDRKGEENPGLYLQSVEGGALRLIQHKEGVQTLYQFTTSDSRYIYFASNDARPDSYALYRYDTTNGERETLYGEPGLWSIADHTAAGKLLLRKSTGSLSAEFSIFDPKNKSLTPVIGQGESEEYDAAFGAHPGEVLVLTPKLGEFRRLYSLNQGKLAPISPEIKWDVSDFSIDQARQRILYEVNEGGYHRLYALDASKLQPLELPKFPGAYHVSAGSSTRDGRFTMLNVESAKAPRTSFVYEWKKKELTRWVVPSAPEADLAQFAAVALEQYPARDGTPIPMLVRRPSKPCDGPCPVVVEFHGGPEGQALPFFSPEAQSFVDAGFILVQPNVRGSDGYGKTWLNADNGPKRLRVITDIEDCAKFVRSQWGKDGVEPRIGIFGGSYGGYSALIGMTMFAGSYDAGVSIVGIANLRSFLLNTSPYRRILRITEYGDPERDREALEKLSPISYLDRVKGPLLLIQGVSDPRVPVGEALQMHDALAARGVAVDLVLFPDEGHGAQRRDNRAYEIGDSIRFFEEHLKGTPPAKR